MTPQADPGLLDPPDEILRELDLGRRWWRSAGEQGEPAYLPGVAARGLNLAEQYLASAVLIDAQRNGVAGHGRARAPPRHPFTAPFNAADEPPTSPSHLIRLQPRTPWPAHGPPDRISRLCRRFSCYT